MGFFFPHHLSAFWWNVCLCFLPILWLNCCCCITIEFVCFFLKSSFSKPFQVHSKFEQKIHVPIYAQPPLLSTLPTWKWKCWSLSHVQLFTTPWIIAHQASLSLELSRQEYWSGLLFPSPGDLPNPGIKLTSPTLQADSSPSEPPRLYIYPHLSGTLLQPMNTH